MVLILQSKLPQMVRRKWEYQLSTQENDEDDLKVTVDYFFRFFRSHVMSEEAAEISERNVEQRKTNLTRSGRMHHDKTMTSSAMALTTNIKEEEIQDL